MSTTLQAFLGLANEIPWLMAPALLIAGLLVITFIKAMFQLTEKASKVMMIAVMLALIGGTVTLLYIY